MHKYLKYATDKALAHDYEPWLEYKLCAVIAKGGRVLSVGFNKHSTNGFVEHYTDVARGYRDYCLSTHAEMDAVLKARDKIDLRGTKVFVSRVKAPGGVGMARPCEICQHVLYNYGVKRAYYTINDNEFGVMKIINPAELVYDKTVVTASNN